MKQYLKFFFIPLLLCRISFSVNIFYEDPEKKDSFALAINFLTNGCAISDGNFKNSIFNKGSNYPHEVLTIPLQAEEIVSDLKEENKDLFIEKIFNTIRNNSAQADPYATFSLLKEFEDKFNNNVEAFIRTQRAFMLMARLLMDAPFTASTDRDRVRNNKCSFLYFFNLGVSQLSLRGKYHDHLYTVYDHWQLYFNEKAYPYHVAPWLDALYFFYQSEAQWLKEISNFYLTGKIVVNIIKNKLSNEHIPYYDIDIDVLHSQFRKYDTTEKTDKHEPAEFRFLLWYKRIYKRYLIIDVNIYWHLLKYFSNDVTNLKQFMQLMIGAGADPTTIIDSKCRTALSLAEELGFSIKPIYSSYGIKKQKL